MLTRPVHSGEIGVAHCGNGLIIKVKDVDYKDEARCILTNEELGELLLRAIREAVKGKFYHQWLKEAAESTSEYSPMTLDILMKDSKLHMNEKTCGLGEAIHQIFTEIGLV
jgi:hypothetical protein